MRNEPDTMLSRLTQDEMVFVIDTYLSDTPVQLHAMAVALANADRSLLSRAARSLVSSSERVRAQEVARMAKCLHVAIGCTRSLKLVPVLLSRLHAEFQRVGPELAGYLYDQVTQSEPTATPPPNPRASTFAARIPRLKP